MRRRRAPYEGRDGNKPDTLTVLRLRVHSIERAGVAPPWVAHSFDPVDKLGPEAWPVAKAELLKALRMLATLTPRALGRTSGAPGGLVVRHRAAGFLG